LMITIFELKFIDWIPASAGMTNIFIIFSYDPPCRATKTQESR